MPEHINPGRPPKRPPVPDLSGAPSGVVAVPALYRTDRPLVISLHPTGQVAGERAMTAWVLAGYLEVDDHGGTRTPVTLFGTDLGLPTAPVQPPTVLGVSCTLCAFLVHDVDRKRTADRGGWSEDPLPDYGPRQWQLLEAEYDRLSWHASLPHQERPGNGGVIA